MGEKEINSRDLVTIDQRPVDIVHVKSATDRRDKNIKEFLRSGIDTYELPQKRKDEKPRRALSKAGSERLAYFAPLFGRPAVYADYEIRESNVDPFREWEYTYTYYDKTKKKVTVTKTIRGYYRFVFNCKLRVLGTDEVVGNREGECSNVESGRETWTSNTVRQQAQKRSFTQAILAYHAMSDILTDEEAIEEIAKRSASKGQAEPKPATPSDNSGFRMPFGKHKGELITEIPAGYLQWCLDNMENLHDETRRAIEAEIERHIKEKKAERNLPEDEKNRPEPSDPTRESLLKEIPDLERACAIKNDQFRPLEARDAFPSLENRDLTKANDQGLIKYWASLNEKLEATKTAKAEGR